MTVRHLAPHIPDLTSEELVSVLLVIYMQKDWDQDGKILIQKGSRDLKYLKGF